jgi:hypothetical protein
MHTIEIPDINFKVEIPSEVSELDPRQALYVMDQTFLLQAGKVSLEQYRINITAYFLNLKVSGKFHYFSHKRNKTIAEQEFVDTINENVFRISETMNSFFVPDEGKQSLVFNYNTTKNLLPQIGRLYGPSEALINCTFFEYKEAHIRYFEFCKTKEDQYLDELIAILYRPKKILHFLRKLLPGYDGELRTRFTSKTNKRYFNNRLKKIAKLPYHIKFCVYLYFQQCENFLITGKPVIDGTEIDLGLLYKGASSSSSGKPDIGLTGILFSLAETNVFGNVEETANTNLYDILSRLYQLKVAYDKLKI